MYHKRKICFYLFLAFFSSTLSFAQIKGWESQESNTEAYLTDAFFINAYTGWVSGNGVPMNTADGGENWTIQDSADAYFMSVYFTDAKQGWAVGFKTSGQNSGIIYHTTDGGEQWDLNSLFFLNDSTVWCVGAAGKILKATSEVVVSIQDKGLIQEKPSRGKRLHQNYPNPFSLETTLSYKLIESGPVRLTVYKRNLLLQTEL